MPNASAGTTQHYLLAQATGVLVSQFAISPDAAFEKLTAEAADLGRPVTEVAREIVQNLGLSLTGQPEVPGQRTGAIDSPSAHR